MTSVINVIYNELLQFIPYSFRLQLGTPSGFTIPVIFCNKYTRKLLVEHHGSLKSKNTWHFCDRNSYRATWPFLAPTAIRLVLGQWLTWLNLQTAGNTSARPLVLRCPGSKQCNTMSTTCKRKNITEYCNISFNVSYI